MKRLNRIFSNLLIKLFQFQVEHWGNVEWAHDIELHDTIARVAAADIFIQCNSSKQLTRQKSVL